MKKLFLLIAMGCQMFTDAVATVRTVNNNTVPVSPGQFSTIASAIAAASTGDTLIIMGSTLYYDNSPITLNKRLVLVGAGYNPKGANTQGTRTAQQFTITAGASGSTIMGMQFDGCLSFSTTGGSSHSGLTFMRNYFNCGGALNFNVDSVYNTQFINNVFGLNTQVNFNSTYIVSSVYFFNNILLCGVSTVAAIVVNSGIYQTLNLDHNLFLVGSRSAPSAGGAYSIAINSNSGSGTGTNTWSVTNNIFYNCSAFAFFASSWPRATAIKNIQYNNSYNVQAGYANISASGNLHSTNPLLASIFGTASASADQYLDFNVDNINLQSTSPGVNAGSDGTNIGPTGGAYPIYGTNATYLTGEPPLPSVRNITISGSSTITTGGTLNVTVTGKKLN